MSIQFEHRVSRRLPAVLATLAAVTLWLSLAACGGSGSGTADNTQQATVPPSAASQPTASQPATTQPAATGDSSVELEFWQSVKDSGDTDQLLAYIKKYPQGQFVELAETRLKNAAAGNGTGAKKVDSPGPTAAKARPPAAAPPQKVLNRRDRVLSVVRRSLSRYSDPRLHIYPDIPRFKADNAASVHGMDPSKILVLYDDGFRAGGKTGFVITDRRIFWRFVSGSDALYLDFQDIQSSIARKNKFLLNGYEVSTTMSSSPRHAAETYADLALALRDAFR